MQQLSRMTRIPLGLMNSTIALTLLLAGVGSLVSMVATSTAAGTATYHTFFSLMFFLVLVMGPTLAASSMAAERDGRTWEALQLTSLTPAAIARGKFLAVYTHLALYLIALAPVAALAFLFGGVTVLDVLCAWVNTFILAAFGVAFGFAVSSKADPPRAALVRTLLLVFFLVPLAYGGFGFGLSYVMPARWPLLHASGGPIWLPLAQVRVPFSWDYLAILVALPALVIAIPTWFFYEITVANLTGRTADRSTGIRRWFLVSSGLLIVAGAVAIAWPETPAFTRFTTVMVLSLWLVFQMFCAFVFLAEPMGPSRRIVRTWQTQGATFLQRSIGPGLFRAFVTQGLMLLLGLGIYAAVALVVSLLGSTALLDAPHLSSYVVLLVPYQLGFGLFFSGFAVWFQSRSAAPSGAVLTARLVLAGTLLLVVVVPWLLAAFVMGFFSRSPEQSLLVAAPSPLYPYALLAATPPSTLRTLPSGINLTCAAAWGLLGLGLFGRAARRCRAALRQDYRDMARTDARLAQESRQSL